MNRREMLQLAAGAACSSYAASLIAEPGIKPASGATEQWDIYEVVLQGPSNGNPFIDVTLSARFTMGHRVIDVNGFYDGDGTYRVRFMPDTIGRWTWTTTSNTPALSGRTGSFDCAAATADNHGPVNTTHQFHFQHADGTPYFPFGTTCYSCAFMGAPFEEQTMQTLSTAGFNKVRLCLLPKPQGHELTLLPFPRSTTGESDLTRLNPAYFQHWEKTILRLRSMGIEADVILFHPYDGWGYKAMPPEANDLYLRYAIARLAAYRNIWWSVANEYDLVKTKTMKDWDHYFHLIQQDDPYSHLRSIHHSRVQYDNSKPWVTHASLQEYDFTKSAEYRQAWGKPILWDEIQYEGNISRRWGNLSPEEMTRRFWLAVVSGTYATHGETYMSPPGTPVWSDGGKLMGTSAPRIAYLRSLLEKITKTGINEYEGSYYLSAGQPNELYLYYFDMHSVGEYDFPLPAGIDFKCTLIDPWNMTSKELPGVFSGKAAKRNAASADPEEKPSAAQSHVTLSGKPYMAALFQKV
jgi:hypothetical protein